MRDSRVPVELYIWEALIVFFPGSLLGPVIQAQLSNVIADRFLAFDILVFAFHLVSEEEQVSVTRWRVRENFLISLGFCQIDSMFGEVLGLLIFILAATFLPGFPASPFLLDCTVDSCIPPLGLFSPLVFLGGSAHILSSLQQTGFQFLPDPFCPTTSYKVPKGTKPLNSGHPWFELWISINDYGYSYYSWISIIGNYGYP